MICPYCRSDITQDRTHMACTRCRTTVHRDCADLYDGRCVVFGCEGRPLVRAPSPARRRRLRTRRASPAARARRALRAAAESAVVPIDDPALVLAALGGLLGLLLWI
jgi:hypothetical protein